jgi:hypothetical protein
MGFQFQGMKGSRDRKGYTDSVQTIFSERDGFVASGHELWRGRPFLQPFSPEGQGQQALDFLLNCHLSIDGGASAFVSVTTSLIQAFVKASNGMSRPFLSIIMLDHPLLGEPNKVQNNASFPESVR